MNILAMRDVGVLGDLVGRSGRSRVVEPAVSFARLGDNDSGIMNMV